MFPFGDTSIARIALWHLGSIKIVSVGYMYSFNHKNFNLLYFQMFLRHSLRYLNPVISMYRL